MTRGVSDGADDPLADFDRLYRAYGDRLVRHCRRHLSEQGDAEDAAHEALLKAWAARERFDRGRPVWPWLATIARNTCIDQLRRHAPRPLDLWREPPPPTPEDVVVGSPDEALEIRSALADLPPLACEALQLRDVEGLAYEEIAARQARSEGAVRNAVARARKHLRVHLEQAPPVGALAPVAVLGGLCRSLRRLWSRSRASAAQHAGHLGQTVESAATPWLGAAPAAGQLVLVATMALTTTVLPLQAARPGPPIVGAADAGVSAPPAADAADDQLLPPALGAADEPEAPAAGPGSVVDDFDPAPAIHPPPTIDPATPAVEPAVRGQLADQVGVVVEAAPTRAPTLVAPARAPEPALAPSADELPLP